MTRGRYDKRYDPGEFYETITLHIASGIGSGISPHPTYVAGSTLYVKPVPVYKEIEEDKTQTNETTVKVITRSYILINPKITKAMYQGIMYDVKEVTELVHKRHILITLKIKT